MIVEGDGTTRKSGGCAHGWSRCLFCRWPRVARRFRCAACGRFRKPALDDLCPRCSDRGFEALRLFDVAA